ncbi:MAG TPA: TadE/TadG family type IV pilus assembly protein [Edaphobacter sp.]|jgi:Flp pilus assembly protein TadG|nr:TadE/TadG family type IV pilus assembly protein [Edaphobacter sp.]
MFRHDLHEERGQAFVELALVLPIFVVLLLGAAEVGRLAYAAIEVNNAARAGVAYAAQTHTTASDFLPGGGIVLAAETEAPDITTMTATAALSCACESSAGVITANPSCSSTDTNLTKCASPSRIVEFVQVNTSAPVNTLFHFPGIPNSVTFQGKATMRVVQ